MTTPTADTFLARLDRLERMTKQAEIAKRIEAPGTAGIDEALSSTSAPGDLGLAVMQAATARSKARRGWR